MSAIDVFLFPSLYEGLGIVALEAQISGLPCIASSNVPKDVVLGDKIDFIDIEDANISDWVDKLKSLSVNLDLRKSFFENNHSISKFDIKQNAKDLEKKYVEILNER